MVLALMAAVVATDQAAKWWAWRHLAEVVINSGGDILVGPRIGAWYASPFSGALLDLLDFGLLSVAVAVLARCRVAAAVSVPATLMIGGWCSNLLDRLGLHYWTAPGSVRGAVDFLHFGDHLYNFADLCIIGGTPLFLLAAGCLGARAAWRPGALGSLPPPARGQARSRVPALVGVGLMLAVVLGATNYGALNYSGVAGPPAPPRPMTGTHTRAHWPGRSLHRVPASGVPAGASTYHVLEVTVEVRLVVEASLGGGLGWRGSVEQQPPCEIDAPACQVLMRADPECPAERPDQVRRVDVQYSGGFPERH
jgi:lipoprotein signal peptidase